MDNKQYNKDDMTRRDFIKGAAIGAAGIAMVGVLPSCAKATEAPVPTATPDSSAAPSGNETSTSEFSQTDTPGVISLSELDESVVEVEKISSFAEEATYDIVVIGAGTAGIPAALSALEEGASVAVLQKESVAVSQGTVGASVKLDQSSEAGIMSFLHKLHSTYDHRPSWELNKEWVYSSDEAISWVEKHLTNIGYDNLGSKQEIHNFDDGTCFVHLMFFSKGIAPAFTKLAEFTEQAGVKFYYETPGVQLIKEENRITGVIGKNSEGKYIRLNAKKGVILATGDYQNNSAMVDKYCPDASVFMKKQVRKTGDGHLMGMMVGAQMEPIGHTKMIHGMATLTNGSNVLRNEPFLAVNLNGERFTYEDVPYESRCTVVTNQPEQVWISIMDDNYYDQVISWGNDPEAPSVANGKREQIADYAEKGNIVKANTLDELAQKMGIPASSLKATVERYNELCDIGADLDFGKPSKYMKPLNQAPYYGIRREFAVSALTSGLMTDVNGQCLDKSNNPIPGLFASGNCSGPFYCDIDYSMFCSGMSVSRCITFGRIAGKYLANL